MRKILLGTTGVVGAALIGMGAAQAQQAPTVRVGGYLQTTLAWVDDDLDSARGTNAGPTGVAGAGRVSRSEMDFRNEVEIHVFVTGKAANGLSYGAVVEIQNDNVGGGSGSALDLDEAYMFVSSPTLGTIRFGEEDSAASIMQVRAPSITGFGADGAFDVGILGTANGTGGNPSLLTGINDGSDATKIVYLSPQFFGFDFGLSYAPNTGEGDRAFLGRPVDTIAVTGGTLAINPTQRDGTGLENEISAALRYRGNFGGVGIAAGFGYMQADAPANTAAGAAIAVPAEDVTAYTLGLTVAAFGLTVGGEYTWGQYAGASVGRTGLARGRDDSNHWLLGATYVMGAFSVGAYYGVATQDNGGTLADREQTGWGLGVAYTVAPGLEVFANYNSYEDKNVNITFGGGTLADRSWTAFFLGTRLAF
jgi:predicted porin